jgi:hypothetical protein
MIKKNLQLEIYSEEEEEEAPPESVSEQNQQE